MPLINGNFTPLQLPKIHARVLLDSSRKWRYRALYGGRNGAKDWSIAGVIIERCIRSTIRVLCTREVQNTLADSIYQLLADAITRMGYSDYFKVIENKITCISTGSVIKFRGLKDLNADNVKSVEGIDLCVIGEAQSLTKRSFKILDPSIRTPGSEIWIVFNPEHIDDFVYDLCVTNKPENMISGYVTYLDVPKEWLTQEILDMAERAKLNKDEYDHIWLGLPKGQGGRVFAKYNEDVHRIRFEREWLPRCDLYMSIDAHRKYYPFVAWNAVTPTNAVITYNEWPRKIDLDGKWYDEAREDKLFEMSLETLAYIILANDLTLQFGGRIVSRTLDPRFKAENPDFVLELQKYGVTGWVDAPFEKIETQRENIKSAIDYNPNLPMIGINTPTQYIDERCENTDRALRHHAWKPGKDKEMETFKDPIDALRYQWSVWDGKPQFIEREQQGAMQPMAIQSLAQFMLNKIKVA